MLIYQALKKDHDELKVLLKQLVETQLGTSQRKDVVMAIKEELIPHSRAEETVFYNSLRAIKNDDLVEMVMGHGYGEHIQGENLLNGLLKNDPECPDFAEDFKHALEHHIDEEEGDMFSAARQVLHDQEAMMMTDLFQSLKEEIKSQGDEKNIQELLMNMLPERFPENPHHL